MIRLHNTYTLQTEEFKPITEGFVGMYHCGPTVYNFAHIGNLRAYVFADILRRLFEYEDYKVKQIINITDVGHLQNDADIGEDKMEVAAKEQMRSTHDIARFFTLAFLRDLSLLNIDTNKDKITFPRATNHIEEQIEMIKTLEEKGFTYVISDGVYFDTSKFPAYGKLGNINLTGQMEGARVGINEEKRNPTDFALWKFNKSDIKREQEWESPWGVGFPGWHIECSAMSKKYLGETFDIHTGGIEHIPTHHQGEIAQSESASGKKFVNYWLHHEHMRVDNTKMSKSLGNTYLLTDIVEKGFSPVSYRYFLLLSHYRTPTNFTWEGLESAQTACRRLKEFFATLPKGNIFSHGKISEIYKKQFIEALEEDINTPEGIAVVWKLVKDESVSPKDKRATLLDFDKVLGLCVEENEFVVTSVPSQVEHLLKEREEARKSKDFAKSDELRAKIRELGFDVRDSEGSQTLEKL